MENKQTQLNIVSIAVGMIAIMLAFMFYLFAENSARDRENSARDRDLQNKLEHIILHNGGYTVDADGNLIKQ